MEKGVLFNTEMVQAILEDRKGSTRRNIKIEFLSGYNPDWTGYKPVLEYGKFFLANSKGEPATKEVKQPYKVGDILYVRETWGICGFDSDNGTMSVTYKADDSHADIELPEEKYLKYYEGMSEAEPDWHPSIFMPREAARIFLKITDVKVQRIQDITEEEARAEGIQWITKDGVIFKFFTSYEEWECIHRKNKKRYSGTPWQDMPKTAKGAFELLWDSIYKFPEDWLGNPWVWVIEFERVEKSKEMKG